MIEISFVIPAYNVEKYIERCLDSIYSQNVNSDIFEVIVIDDGSTDQTLSILNEYNRQHTNMTIVTQKNQGPSVARNKGIDLSKGKYIWFVDSDDYIEKDALYRLLNIIKLASIDILIFTLKDIHIDGTISYGNIPANLENYIMSGRCAAEQGFEVGSVSLALWRKDFIKSNNLSFMPGVNWGEDSLFWFCAILLAPKVMMINIPFYVYVRRMQSLTTANSLDKRKNQLFCEIKKIKAISSFSRKYIEVDNDLCKIANRQSEKMLFGILFFLLKNKFSSKWHGINKDIVKRLKEEKLYPMKKPFYCFKHLVLSLFLNCEYMII